MSIPPTCRGLILLMSEILHHLGMQKTLLNNGTTYLSTGAEFLPATVSHYADSSPRSVSLIYKECWKFAALPSLGYATEPPQHGSNFGATWREDTRIKTGGQEEWNQESVYCYVPGSQEISLSIATLDWEYTQVFTYVDLKTSIWDRFSSCLNICHPKMHSMFRSFLFRKIFLERPWYYINWNTCIHFKAGIEAWLFFCRHKTSAVPPPGEARTKCAASAASECTGGWVSWAGWWVSCFTYQKTIPGGYLYLQCQDVKFCWVLWRAQCVVACARSVKNEPWWWWWWRTTTTTTTMTVF